MHGIVAMADEFAMMALDKLSKENAKLREENEALRAEVAALRAELGRMSPSPPPQVSPVRADAERLSVTRKVGRLG